MSGQNSYSFVTEDFGHAPLEVPKPIPTAALQTTAATLYTAADGFDFVVKHLWVANVTGGAATYTIYKVPAGGAAGIGNAVAFQSTIAANTTQRLDFLIEDLLEPGAALAALCSSNDAVNIGGWGMDYQGRVR